MVSFKLDSNMAGLTDEEREQLEKAKKMPVVYDEDCPALTEEMELAFFAARKAKPYPKEPITVYVSRDTVEKAKTMGENYGSVLGQLLDKAMGSYPPATT